MTHRSFSASPAARRALTMVELLVALVVVSVLSIATTILLQGAARTNTNVNAMFSSQWEVETALRRIIQETRLCTSIVSVSANSLTIVTEPDTSNNNVSYTVTYAAVTAADGTQQLQETNTSTAVGTAVLVHNLTAFTVALGNINGKSVVNITITAGTSTPTVRTITISPRNL